MINLDTLKEEYIKFRKSEWREQWRKDHYRELGYMRHTEIPADMVPEPPESIVPCAWMSEVWPTGGVVIDAEAFAALPKAKQNKILKQLEKFRKGVKK